jgi:hypothetical protein
VTEEDDDALMAGLRAVVARFDGPPADLERESVALYSWRAPDVELAELSADSRELEGSVRSDGGAFLLRFSAGHWVLTVDTTVTGRVGRSIIGQIEPGERGTVVVRRRSYQVRRVEADDKGRFAVADLEPGPISLRWHPSAPSPQTGRPGANGQPGAVETPWFVI